MEIKKALLVADITAEGLARKADLHPNTVRAAINGVRMTPRTAYKLETTFEKMGIKIVLSGQDRRNRR